MSRDDLAAAMDAADAAGGEDLDAGQRRRDHRGRDGRAAPARLPKGRRQVLARDLGDVARLGERLELVRAEADPDPSIVRGDRGRHGTSGTDRGFGGTRRPQILGPRQAVRGDRGLEGHDGASRLEGLPDLGGQAEQVVRRAHLRQA